MFPKPRLLLAFLAAGAAALAVPVEFRFSLPADPAVKNPFAREIWANVVTPSGGTLQLPAFYIGSNEYGVRARPLEAGLYRLGAVSESTPGHAHDTLTAKPNSPEQVEVPAKGRSRLPSIYVDPRNPHGFVRSDGHPFFPVGANLAWPEGDNPNFYPDAFTAFAKANLNWARIWMVHWGRLNLDWVPDWAGSQPPLGGLDGAVAQRWDDLLEAAEESGVYVQVTLQHHGQYSSQTNSNWGDNPWNVAKGGFLKTPEEFFTHPRARLLTALKYRYIVARYGWSPAVFSWELFNEVHWVDAMTNHHEDDVAQWHAAMADLLRSVDVYRHMVTTSTENLRSPIYAKMDYYQPHLYCANLIAGARYFDPSESALAKPVFYGEYGADHVAIDEAAKKAGVALVAPAWAAIMGQGMLAAQPWEGAALLKAGRLEELGGVNRFLVLSHLVAHRSSEPFSAVVDTEAKVPLRIVASQVWQRKPAPDLAIAVDGTEAPDLASIPEILVGSAGSIADGFPGRATYHFTLPKLATLRAQVQQVGGSGGALRVELDGKTVFEKAWPGKDNGLPASYPLEAGAGPHTLVVMNPGTSDWVDIPSVDLGVEVPAIAAIGRRDPEFIALWLWRRDGLLELKAPEPIPGTLLIGEVPAGTWTVTWWDTVRGRPGQPARVVHGGGALRLPVPPIARSAAVVLSRQS